MLVSQSQNKNIKNTHTYIFPMLNVICVKIQEQIRTTSAFLFSFSAHLLLCHLFFDALDW